MMNAQNTKYAQGASRFAFDHARYAAAFKAVGNKKMANYHRKQVIELAQWLEAGLTKCAGCAA